MEKNELLRKKVLQKINPDAKFFDGLDNAIVGFIHKAGQRSVVCYDVDKVVDILMGDMKLTEMQVYDKLANEYVGGREENDPVFIELRDYLENEETLD